MSVTLQERRERAEGQIESLLSGMDEMVRQAYESLLERGADYEELTEKQEVARLEGFHDYIIVREETGVEHPRLEEYIEVKKRRGDELISFGTGKHRKPIEGEGTAPELVNETPDVLITGHPGAGHGIDRFYKGSPVEEVEVKPVFFDIHKNAEITSDPPAMIITGAPGLGKGFSSKTEMLKNVVAEKERGRRAAQVPTTTAVHNLVEEKEAEEMSAATRSIFYDKDDEEVVILSEVDEDKGNGFVARVPEKKPEPDFEELLSADKEEREEEKELIAQADEEKEKETPRITTRQIVEKDFSLKLGGYDQEEVDDFLDEVVEFMRESHGASEWLDYAKSMGNKEFAKKSGFKKGCAPVEVKEFIKELQVEFEIKASEA